MLLLRVVRRLLDEALVCLLRLARGLQGLLGRLLHRSLRGLLRRLLGLPSWKSHTLSPREPTVSRTRARDRVGGVASQGRFGERNKRRSQTNLM